MHPGTWMHCWHGSCFDYKCHHYLDIHIKCGEMSLLVLYLQHMFCIAATPMVNRVLFVMHWRKKKQCLFSESVSWKINRTCSECFTLKLLTGTSKVKITAWIDTPIVFFALSVRLQAFTNYIYLFSPEVTLGSFMCSERQIDIWSCQVGFPKWDVTKCSFNVQQK